MNERAHIRVVESARGAAAYYILFHHVILLANAEKTLSGNIVLDSIREFSSAFTTHALMMFFLVSGFSIHYANNRRISSFNGPEIRRYLYKRMRRIYPIYVLAVGLSLLSLAVIHWLGAGAAWPFPDEVQFIGALLFFCDLPSRSGTWIATLSTNGPLWSLSYEVLYYVAYPAFAVLVARGSPARAIVYGASVSGMAVTTALAFGPTQISNIASLYILWCLGALLATWRRESYVLRIKPICYFTVVFAGIQSLLLFESLLLWRIPLGFNLYVGLVLFVVMSGFLADWQSWTWRRKEQVLGVALVVLWTSLIIAIAVILDTQESRVCPRD